MTIYIENEAAKQLDFDFKQIIEKVVTECIAYEKCPYEAEINILLTNDNEIKEINKEFRGIDKPTDVLSFPAIDFIAGNFPAIDFTAGNSPAIGFNIANLGEAGSEYFNPETGELILGDIVISVDRAGAQAEEYGHSIIREIAFLTAHSMFHLMGYDHMTDEEREVMEEKQEEVLKRLEILR